MRVLSRLSLVVLVVALSGCGVEAGVSSKPKELDGDTLASRANTQLEKQNPQMVPGDLSCDDVKFEVGASSRCMRTVVFDDGRLVRIGATVVIDEVEGGGHFNIKVDDAPEEFGMTGKAVFTDLSTQYAKRYGATPTGSCPEYLPGTVGETITCSLETPDEKLDVVVKVTEVDAETFETQYTFQAVDQDR